MDALAPGDALLIVDVQNDFMPGGSLAVPHAGEIIAPLNAVIARFARRRLPIYATRDWHPAKHCSFRDQGGTWPPHCVADSPGGEFSAELRLPETVTVISKATTPDADAYSGFAGTDLASRLRAAGVRRLFVGGLATDYCVVNTVIDALALGFSVILLPDAMRAVDANPGDGARALARMRSHGAEEERSEQLAG